MKTKASRSSIRSLCRWFAENVRDGDKPYTLDPNQAAIVLENAKNCLVTARAGSGKTRTIVARVIYLIARQGVQPDEIVVFTFNKKATFEVNARLANITVAGRPLFRGANIARTFHSFAFNYLDSNVFCKNVIDEESFNKLIPKILDRLLADSPRHYTEHERDHLFRNATVFINRAEQRYFEDYAALKKRIPDEPNPNSPLFYRALVSYHACLKADNLTNFNQVVATAARDIRQKLPKFPYRYIFVDEYQDFSLLFYTLITAIRAACPSAKLLAVGDDWQAINGFAGSDLCYFQNFHEYFPEDSVKHFIPTNYRSGARIVENANYFMSKSLGDNQGCRSGNHLRSHVHLVDLKTISVQQTGNTPYQVEQMLCVVADICNSHPGKSVYILTRNNDLFCANWSVENFVRQLWPRIREHDKILYNTIHKSKGLEADIVIMLEINAGDFPREPNTSELFTAFGETLETRLNEEKRLFYVGLTRAKEDLYILTNTPAYRSGSAEINFLRMLNPDWLEEYELL